MVSSKVFLIRGSSGSLDRRKHGKTLLYGTTKEFLQYFGLKDLTELPTLKELTREEACIVKKVALLTTLFVLFIFITGASAKTTYTVRKVTVFILLQKNSR